MMRMRPVAETDASALERLGELNWQGLTVLPGNTLAWREKIARSVATFARGENVPQLDDLYLFVLEDTERKQLVGTSQIVGKTAGSSTLGHYYHRENLALPPLEGVAKRTLDVLVPVRREAVVTEVGGLFLDPAVRRKGLSGLASLARFLFIAAHSKRFCAQVIAEIRGHIDDQRTSIFWDAVGRHFWDVEYADVMQHLNRDTSIVSALMSPIPIYLFLLGAAVCEGIGQAHPLSQIALNRLIDQGFQITGDVDPFDAGPKVMAETAKIRVMRQHRQAVVGAIKSVGNSSARALMANTSLQFRACIAPMTAIDHQSIAIDEATAQALQVAPGDRVLLIQKETHA
jgi:arginine N-succinyltransferase